MRRRIATVVSVLLAQVLLLGVQAAAGSAAASSRTDHIRVGVAVLDFDPLADSGQPLSTDQGWNDTLEMQAAYIDDVGTASEGIVEHRVAESTTIRDFPVKAGGFKFTNATYHGCLVDASPGYCKALIDYGAVLNTKFDHHVKSSCQLLRQGRIDEIWMWGGPWFGYLEQMLVAPNTLCPDVRRPFVVMGFSYERGEPEMLHDLGHRAETLIESAIGFDLWDRFDGQRGRYSQDFACPGQPDETHPEAESSQSHAGNVHFPPNAYCHYQYDRNYPVLSDADDWANFPNLTGRRTLIDSNTWGGTQRGFLVWWLGRFPRTTGSTLGVEHDWWRYVYLVPDRLP